MRVGLDLDGCVYRFTRAVNEALATRSGYQFGEWRTWNYVKPRVTRADWNWLWTPAASTEIFGRVDCLYPGAPTAVRWLAKHSELVIITARPEHARADAQTLLDFMRVTPGEVHVLGHQVLKSSVPRCDVYVEDNADNALELSQLTGSPVLVPRRYWNQHLAEVPGKIIKYSSWREVTEWVRQHQHTSTR